MEVTSEDGKIQVELEGFEPYWLLRILLHAKLGDSPKLEIATHPMLNDLIEGIEEERHKEGAKPEWRIGAEFSEESHVQAPASIYMLETWTKAGESQGEFKEAIFPWIVQGELKRDIFIEPGRRVALPERSEHQVDNSFGIVVRCWQSERYSHYKCYVALEIDADMQDKPEGPPEIVCLDASELRIVG